jgi:hypothetical protein
LAINACCFGLLFLGGFFWSRDGNVYRWLGLLSALSGSLGFVLTWLWLFGWLWCRDWTVAEQQRYYGGDMARPPKEYQAFTSLVDRLLAVPKTEVDRRQAEYRKVAAKNPRKRGPKPKA